MIKIYKITAMASTFKSFMLKVYEFDIEKDTPKQYTVNNNGRIKKSEMDKITDHGTSFHNQYNIFTTDKSLVDGYKMQLLKKFEDHYRVEKVRVDRGLENVMDMIDKLENK